jgi:parallel beta-helix repeat protein
VVVALAVVGAPGVAQAAPAAGQVRYSASSNTLYLTAGTATLTAIKAACAAAPLTLASPTTRTWELDADLVVQNGATLRLHGTAAGGDVNVLRLRSSADALKTHVSTLTAQYGDLDLDSVTVTSWDPATGAPDTDPNPPKGAPADARGRSFIRAVSYLDGTTPRESRMDIANSEVSNLGWYDAESYGVTYKGRGCDASHLSVCAALNVYGSERNSHFHQDYMGTYLYDGYQMVFSGNEYDHNVMYGLDGHDDSDYLTITGNHFHHNGDHGVICSQRCDHVAIKDNESDHNGIPPFAFPDDPDLSDNQVHGIMLHRGITDSVVSGNNVHDQPNGAGIAVFDSTGNVLENNTITGAKYGLRFSVGATGTQVLENAVIRSGKYAVFTYQGTDLPSYSTPSGRPTNLYFARNTLDSGTGVALQINDADGTSLVGNKITGTTQTRNSTGTTFH